MSTTEPTVWMTDAEAAAYVGTTARHIRELRYQREIPFSRLGAKSPRINRDDLDTFLASRRVEARSGR
jgi:excisionase family DNA binding protein